MLDTKEYYTIARKIIMTHYPFMMRQNGFEEWMVSYLMTADWKFDGRGGIEGFRKSYAKYAYLDWCNNHGRSDTEKLDNQLESPSSNIAEKVDILDAMEILTEREQKVLELYHFHGYTLDEVGKEFNLCRERIRQIKDNAYAKMRKCLE